MEDSKKELLSYLENVALLLLGILFVAFPLVFSSMTTDAFSLPKQMLLGAVALVSLLLFGVRTLVEGKVKIRTTPFDLPILLFTVIIFLSTYFSINKYDGFVSFVPLLFAILIYFILVNVARSQNAILFLVSALILGAGVESLLALISFFKLYPLPMVYTHYQGFSTLGSLLDQGMYFAFTLPLAGYIAWPILGMSASDSHSHRTSAFGEELQGVTTKTIGFAVGFVVILLGLLVTFYLLIAVQKPLILPFETGFQTALASISQDTGRVFKGFLFGSGYGTYITDFTRFKNVTFNANQSLWSFTFFRSSSLILELLATTGLLGFLSFLFILYRIVKQRVFFLPIILIAVAGFILPFSPSLTDLFFIILGIFATLLALHEPHRFPDFEFELVALKKGLFTAVPEGEAGDRNIAGKYGLLLPALFCLCLVVIVGALGYFTGRYLFSDITFQRSLVAASQNNGSLTYQLEAQAIQQFPFRDSYYRIFAQTNLALANSLAGAQPKGSSPSAAVQQNVLTLIQQAINSARTGVTVAPETSMNWDTLSQVYRSLIGFGQNADQFAILTNQQAISLDPNNPQEFINLGGIYYQIGDFSNAENSFSTAIKLKQDYANAWYNLGHAAENKGNLTDAMTAYQTVKALVANNKSNLKVINTEIDALQKKIGEQAKQAQAQAQGAAVNQPPLNVNQSATQLPERNPKAVIPSPAVTVTPTAAVTPKVSVSPTSPTVKNTSPTPSQ